MLIGWRQRIDRARRDPESGFTLVEVSVAIALFGMVMILMTTMVAGSLRGVLLGKQRSVATAFGNRVVEQARNLEYDDVGLIASDTTLATDPLIVTIDGLKKYATDDPCSAGTRYEPIEYATNAAGHPYNPHMVQTQQGSTRLTRYVYVTGVDETCPPDGVVDYKRVIVRTVFSDPALPSTAISNEVRAESFISPKSPGSPGSPPQDSSLPPLSGLAAVRGAVSDVTFDTAPSGADSSSPSADRLTMGLTRSQGGTGVIAVSQVDCLATSPRLSAGDDQIGNHSLALSADDDPTTASPGNGPYSDTRPHNDTPTGDLNGYLVEQSVTSITNCTADAQPWPKLPNASGYADLASTATFAADVTGLGLPVSTVELVKAVGSRSAQQIEHSGTTQAARTIGLEGSSSLTELTALRSTVGSFAAASGLLQVRPHLITAVATAAASTGTVALSAGTGLDVDVFDPGMTLTSCQSRPTPAYCRIRIRPDDPGFTGRSVDVAENMESDQHSYSFQTHIDFAAPSLGSRVTGGGTVYEATYRPMTASTRLILRVLDLTNPLAPVYKTVFDAKVEIDLGEIVARACHGVALGAAGCF